MKDIPEGRRSPPAGALESGSPYAVARDATPRGAALGRVVHCKREAYDVYIGRPGKWGNPFTINEVHPREQAIAQFARWARDSLDPRAIWIRENVAKLRGKVLGCWCAPKACHGDVLLGMAEQSDGDGV